MTLKQDTKIGLTFGQIISIISLSIMMIGGFVNLKTDISGLQLKSDYSIERMNKHEESNKEDLRAIVIDVKESLKEIKQDIKSIKNQR